MGKVGVAANGTRDDPVNVMPSAEKLAEGNCQGRQAHRVSQLGFVDRFRPSKVEATAYGTGQKWHVKD